MPTLVVPSLVILHIADVLMCSNVRQLSKLSNVRVKGEEVEINLPVIGTLKVPLTTIRRWWRACREIEEYYGACDYYTTAYNFLSQVLDKEILIQT